MQTYYIKVETKSDPAHYVNEPFEIQSDDPTQALKERLNLNYRASVRENEGIAYYTPQVGENNGVVYTASLDPMPEIRVYKIPDYRIDKFRSDIRSLNRRADRLGVPLITYQELGTELVEYQDTRDPSGRTVKRSYKAVLVTVQGPVVRLEGWKFIACLDHVGDENIVISDGPVPLEYRTAGPKCEHCDTSRMRYKTYIVHHDTQGYKQVGSTCLADFTGHKNADRVAALCESVWEFDPGDYEEYEGGCGRTPSYIDLKSIVALSHKIIRTKGFISRTRAKDSGYSEIATADTIADYIEPRRTPREKEDIIDIESEDTQAVKEIFKWAGAIDPAVNSEYMFNVRVIFQSGSIHYRYLGLAVASVSTYLNSLRKKAELLEFNNEHFGTIKKRETFDLKLLWIKAVEGIYGTSDMMKFVDSGNRMAVWFNSGSRHVNESDEWTEGITYRVKATVKRHDMYQDMAQTILNRVKWVETLSDPDQNNGTEGPDNPGATT